MACFLFSLLLAYFLIGADASKLKDRRAGRSALDTHAVASSRGFLQPDIATASQPGSANVGMVSLDSEEETTLHRMQWWAKDGSALPPTDKYLLFTQDVSGLNNIRIGWEMSALVAQYTGRTLVLPPAHSIYLLDWGRRVTGFLPKALESGQTKTAMEDLINVPQLKAALPTLTWEEFQEHTGTTWEQAVNQSQKLEGENFAECAQIPDYKKVTAQFLFMDGGTDNRREGFNCGQWWRNGGPKDGLKNEVGDQGFALLTHGFSWHDDAFRIAAKAVNYLGLFKYTALHARYNDFEKNFGRQPKPQEVLDSLSTWSKDGTKLYIASDEPDKFAGLDKHGAQVVMWKDLVGEGASTDKLLDKERAKFSEERWFKLTGPIEELICTYAKIFVGSDKSSFSGHIDAMRIQAEAPTTTRVMHTDTFPVEDVKANIAAWTDKGGESAFEPLPRSKGNVFFLQLASYEEEE